MSPAATGAIASATRASRASPPPDKRLATISIWLSVRVRGNGRRACRPVNRRSVQGHENDFDWRESAAAIPTDQSRAETEPRIRLRLQTTRATVVPPRTRTESRDERPSHTRTDWTCQPLASVPGNESSRALK